MRFRTKLLLVLLPLVLLGQFVLAELLERNADRLIFKEFQDKAAAIAATAAATLNGDLHARLSSRNDESSAEYQSLRTQLRALRDANRNQNTWVKFLYTVVQDPENKNLLLYGVDPEEERSAYSHYGDVVHAKALQGIHLSKPHVFDDFVEDEFGTWLTAMHPLRTSQGSVVGAVVVDIDSSRVIAAQTAFLYSGLSVLGIGIIFTLIAGLIIARMVSKPLETLEGSIMRIGKGDFDAPIPISSRDEFGSAAQALRVMASDLKERERVKSAFARYVSHQVADTILKSSDGAGLKGERRRITVLFCDIRGFTTMSERLPPENVVAVLNEYFERMVDIIFKHQGTLDKFIGDGLMAIFGAPYEDAYQEEHALRAALEMCAELKTLSENMQQQFGVSLRIGIGINSGLAIVGNIGSTKRMDYTAIGDTVNLASRLESRTKDEGVEMLLSEYTYAALRGNYGAQLRRVGELEVKGRSDRVVAYTWQEGNPTS